MWKARRQLAFIIVCFAFHACDARHIDVIQQDSTKTSKVSNKSHEKSSLSRISVPSELQHLVSNNPEAQAVKKGSSLEENSVQGDDHWGKNRNSSLKDQFKIRRPKATEAVQINDSPARESRKLPKKMGKQKQDFNLDYDPPEIYPPAHN